MSENIIVEILWGLPGSGKTYYANQQVESSKKAITVLGTGSNKPTTFIIDVDDIKSHGIKNKVYGFLPDKISCKLNHLIKYEKYNKIIIDGLFTSNEDVFDIIYVIKDNLRNITDNFNLIFKIVFWEKDIDSCLINDKNRRNLNSKTTINSHKFENPNLYKLNEDLNENIQIINKKVVIKDKYIQDYHNFLGKIRVLGVFINDDSNILLCESWSGGGTCGHYTGNISTVEGSPARDFDIFNQILQGLCPNISFTDYTKIKNASCEVVVEHNKDYYGGVIAEFTNTVYLNKLFDSLVEHISLDEEQNTKYIITDEIKIIDGCEYKICYMKI